MEAPHKERLTGALIVVAVLVIVLPELFSGSGKSNAPAATPSDGGPPVRTYSLELGAPAVAPAQDRSTAVALNPVPPGAAALELPTPVPQPPAAPAPPEVTAPKVTTPQAAAVPAANVKPNAVPVMSPRKAWWTQLGSFSARENAERLARDLRAKGYSIDVARIIVGNKDLFRVRAGPVANREAALELQTRLAAAGHKSRLVPP